MNQTQLRQQPKRIIISGGGTGGHIFPAISIANALKKKDSSIEILFVGAIGKMEMEKVPAAGYKITGLPVAGFHRRLTLKNLTFFFKLFASMMKARKVIKEFKPDAAVGVGGYASGPVLRVACSRNIPTVIQEQNSYPGVTNKILAKKADKICVAYEGMEKYFPAEKIIITGNPVRQDIIEHINIEKAYEHFQVTGNRKVLLIVGGSLGARTINESICANLDFLLREKIQVIWQTGKSFFNQAKNEITQYATQDIKVFEFITRMDYAFVIADIVISRAGASTISELCLVHKPAILVPSPNVAEDHQTKNAMALVNKNAALMVTDAEAREKLVNEAIKLINDDFTKNTFNQNIAKMAYKNSADIIADEILKLIEEKKRHAV
ncbi:MAG: undecaprenyldiphospho-muramoylpentapeptide beta-N-acetylglucosaminyltransferase [Bacteroidetes bacterium RIFOXYA12_FULL_35_11]|nr:MAG: undecaprenyldiphospho-muramoylpentapeptide beta-N-acetylglucosaminyltransferase [Bacteroidetes bacterium GWF2_35_48]OFY79254.1 MAG: undecaprenyldiphospho-muramoylpentapeptide beta-N-acetylglucosaminyltransferase [Bacteroidetes bacterium RIFOXYA12_FULL_35_11]OFY96446.1 MAG: undecaprenyldiphospho-muramoylpentapeptide beta-N-acetylglucosaminyltransferase [Bacteroidetes bacterium RIFOXYC12_FULL_35_7]HBX50503.1 undecaprenyldiphospho-muramoylpentapeptide beta-N-acetylglucosaminyltransferase [B